MVRIIRGSRSALLAGCTALGLTIAAGSPARAIEDDGRGNTLDTFLTMFGMGDKPDAPNIQYRERSPLVLPPGSQLPEPQKPAAQRTAAWPQDQEAVRARKKAEEARVRYDNDHIATARELKTEGHIDPAVFAKQTSGPKPCSMDPFEKATGCAPGTYWGSLAATTELDHGDKQANNGPERQYLTQPPKEYLKPTQNVKATFDARKTDDEDPRAFYWDRGKAKE